MTNGQDAGRKILENHVENTMEALGFKVFRFVDTRDNFDLLEPRRLIKNVPYHPNLFGCRSRSEFVIEDDVQGRRVRVECRWQASDGSVDAAAKA